MGFRLSKDVNLSEIDGCFIRSYKDGIDQKFYRMVDIHKLFEPVTVTVPANIMERLLHEQRRIDAIA